METSFRSQFVSHTNDKPKFPPDNWITNSDVNSSRGSLKSTKIVKQNTENTGTYANALNKTLDQSSKDSCSTGTNTNFLVTKLSNTDPEAYYSDRLLDAKSKGNVSDVIHYLNQLSDHYLELYYKQNTNPISQHNSLLKAVKLLNSAIGILKTNDSKDVCLQSSLFSKLERIEKIYLRSQGITTFQDHNYLKEQRLFLANSRIAAEKSSLGPFEITHLLTESFKKLLKIFIDEAEFIFGKSPVSWAAFSMGSMARGEMCPYSDVEFGFLVEENNEDALRYFRSVSKFLQLRIINMGETTFSVFGDHEPSPTPDGFCLDTGGNTPLGVEGWYELICTPYQLAQFQTKKCMEENIILTNTLNCIGYLAGDERLILDYEKEKDIESSIAFSNQPFRETLALRLLHGHLQEFEPNLSGEKENLKAFGIKKELYRPLQEILSSLAIFFNVKLKNSLEKIHTLVHLGVFSNEGSKNLKKALVQVVQLRLSAHFFYKNEQEFLHHIQNNRSPDPTQLYLDEKMQDQLQSIYRVIIPLHRCAKKFLEEKVKSVFYKSTFYDDKFVDLANSYLYKKILKDVSVIKWESSSNSNSELIKFYQAAVSLDPHDIEALISLAELEAGIRKFETALARNMLALKLIDKKKEEKNTFTINIYNEEKNTSTINVYNETNPIYRSAAIHRNRIALMRIDKKNKKNEKENTPIIEIYNEEKYSSSIRIYNNIGNIHYSLRDYEEGLKCYQKALELRRKVFGEYHSEVAKSYRKIEEFYCERGNHVEARKYNDKALKALNNSSQPVVKKIFLQTFQDLLSGNIYKVCDDYVKNLSAIGDVISSTEENPSRLENLGTLLRTGFIDLFGDTDRDFALMDVHLKAEQYEKALYHSKKALKKVKLGAVENSPILARLYFQMGDLYAHLKEHENAIDSYQKSLHIYLDSGENELIAQLYLKTGNLYEHLKEHENAIDSYRKCLPIFQNFDDNRGVAQLYFRIGEIYTCLEKHENALESYQKSLHACLVLGESKWIAQIYFKIGETFTCLKEHENALVSFQESLKEFQKILGDKHLELADIYNKIGSICMDLNRYEQALDYYKKGLEIRSERFCENHPLLNESHQFINNASKYLAKPENAHIPRLQQQHRVIGIQRSVKSTKKLDEPS